VEVEEKTSCSKCIFTTELREWGELRRLEGRNRTSLLGEGREAISLISIGIDKEREATSTTEKPTHGPQPKERRSRTIRGKGTTMFFTKVGIGKISIKKKKRDSPPTAHERDGEGGEKWDGEGEGKGLIYRVCYPVLEKGREGSDEEELFKRRSRDGDEKNDEDT